MVGELQYATGGSIPGSVAGRYFRANIGAPTMGWNTVDPESKMKPLYAVTLDNMFPDRGRVMSRRGSAQYADTTDSGDIGTLFNYVSGSTSKLYAFSPTTIYDVTNANAITQPTRVPTAALTSNRWSCANSNGNAIMVNGADTPLRIDATGAFVAHGFSGTGLTASDLKTVTVHQNRLYFTAKDSATIWYGGTDAVTGTLTSFNVGQIAPEGGNAVAIGSLTLDTGAGPDDLLAIFMSRGQVLVYSGDDPSEADRFAIQGVFNIGRVIGDRPLVKLAGDLIAITADGYVPVLQFLGAGRRARSLALSDNISTAVADAVRMHGTKTGWQAIFHPEANWLLFNVPGADVQHVMNTTSGAWCRFTGLEAKCWGRFGDSIYFGGAGGKVYQADTGGTDAGTAIFALGQSAYNNLGSAHDKLFRNIRAHLEGNRLIAEVSVGGAVDFRRELEGLDAVQLTSEGTPWDTALWDTFKWGSGRSRYREWEPMNDQGEFISMAVRASITGGQLEWLSSDVSYDRSGAIIGTLE